MRNVVKRATLLCPGKFIGKEQLPPELWLLPEGPGRTTGSRKDMERELIREVMERCEYNKTEAAKILQIDRKTLYNKLKAYGMEG
jgi:two-component system response regulator HydG